MEDAEKQAKNKVDAIRPYMWKKGQSGNIMGRPKGKTMKEYAQEYLSRMTDEERDEWLEGINKDIIWKMAENNPATATDITTGGEKLPTPIINVVSKDIGNEQNPFAV